MENSSSVQLRTSALLKNLGTLTLLIVALPLNLAIVVAAVLWNGIISPFKKSKIIDNPQNILLTGGKMTKALQLARSFIEANGILALPRKRYCNIKFIRKYYLLPLTFYNSHD